MGLKQPGSQGWLFRQVVGVRDLLGKIRIIFFFEMSFFTQFRLCEALRDFSMQQMEKWSEEYKAEQRSDESEN